MKYNRIENAKRNIIYGVLLQIIIIFMPFVIRVMIVRSMGAEYVGLSSLYSSIITVLNVTELGFGSAIVYAMYKPIAEDDLSKVCALLFFYRKIYYVVAIIVLTAGIVVMPFLQYLVKGECPDNINLYYLYLLYLLNTVTSYIFGSYKRSVLLAYQRQDVISKLTIFVQIVIYSLEILSLIFIKDYYLYVILIILGNIAINILIARHVDRNYEHIYAFGTITTSEKKEILEKVKGLLVNRVLSVSRNSSDTIFITSFTGLISTAIYSNYLFVVTALNEFVFTIANSITAGVGNGLVLNDEEKNYNDFMKIDIIYMAMCSICVFGMLNFYRFFVSLFFGKQYLLNVRTECLFCVLFFVINTGCIKNVFINAAGLWDQTKKYSIMEAVCNCIFNFIGVIHLGISGVLLATIISLLLFDFIFVTKVLFKNVFRKHSVISYWALNMFYGGCILGITQIGRMVNVFFSSLLLKSLVSFVIESVVLIGILYFMSIRNNTFRDAKNILMLLKK